MDNLKVAAAVAGILAASASAVSLAAGPTAAQANAATYKFYVAGSSAAAGGFAAAIGADLCSGGSSNLSQFTSVPSTATTSTPDFRAYSCVAAAGKGGNAAGSLTTIYYRAEGGSITGVFPEINNTQINFLDLSSAGGCVQTTGTQQCVVGGTSAGNGKTDNFPSGVAKHAAEFGISDLEPAVFGNGSGAKYAGGGNQNPVGTYAASFIGPAQTETALLAMSQTRLFQQTFGIVASSNLGITDISSDAMQAILSGAVTDWGSIPTAAGTPVAAAGTQIVVCQRDLGSGTRAASDIYFTGDGCNVVQSSSALTDTSGSTGQPAADNYSTLEELACVNTNSNAIGYVSIDNMTASKIGSTGLFKNVVGLTLNGVKASNLTAAAGGYQFAYEASGNDNVAAQAANPNAASFYSYLKGALQKVATAPQSAQINALAYVPGNTPKPNVAGNGTGSTPIYVSAYDRKGNSCSNLNTEL